MTVAIIKARPVKSDSELPEGLRGCHPRVVLAYRMTCRRRDGSLDEDRKSWLVVQHDPHTTHTVNGREVQGRATVAWFPKASIFSRPAYMGRFWGPESLDDALNCAAREEATGPDRSVCAYLPRGKASKPRDMQRKKAYEWENGLGCFRGKFFADVTEAQAFANSITKQLGDVPATVKLLNRFGSSHGGLTGVSLTKGMGTPWILCHELAHTLTLRRDHRTNGKRTTAAHGAEWMALYCLLLALTIKPGQFESLVASARAFGLKVAELPPDLSILLRGSALEWKAAAKESTT